MKPTELGYPLGFWRLGAFKLAASLPCRSLICGVFLAGAAPPILAAQVPDEHELRFVHAVYQTALSGVLLADCPLTRLNPKMRRPAVCTRVEGLLSGTDQIDLVRGAINGAIRGFQVQGIGIRQTRDWTLETLGKASNGADVSMYTEEIAFDGMPMMIAYAPDALELTFLFPQRPLATDPPVPFESAGQWFAVTAMPRSRSLS